MAGNMITLKAGWFVDGTGAPVVKDICLRFNGNGIDSISGWSAGALEGEEVLDFSDHTIIPGLVDAHCHLAISGTTDSPLRKRQLNADGSEIRSLIARHVNDYLSYGVIAVRDGGDRNGLVLKFKSEAHSESPVRMNLQSSGPAWHRKGRYGGFIGQAVSGSGSLHEAIRKQSCHPDHIKIINSGINSLTIFGQRTPAQFSLEELQAAVSAAEGVGCGVMVHANGEEPVNRAVLSGCQSIEHGFFMGEENLQEMAVRRTTWVPTACTIQACAELAHRFDEISYDVAMRTLEHQVSQIRKAVELGVPVAIGTDAGSIGVFHGYSMIREMRLFLDAGCSTAEVIRLASTNGVALLGGKGAGPLIPGTRANFIAVKGAPELLPESLNEVSAVYIDGCCVTGGTDISSVCSCDAV